MLFYYASDNKIFYDKIGALTYHRQTGHKIFFNYHDEVFSNIDWTIDPPGSLEFHYKNQAQRIRDEYDYVVLFYSGGYDSSNILETFYFNNIKLDKIVCVGAFSQDNFKGSDENHNKELYDNAFPYLEQLGLTSITQVCDYTEYFNNIKNLSIHSYGDEWIKNVGPWYSPHNWFWKDIHEYVVPKNMQNKKIALIWGKDKPKLAALNNKVGFCFTDVSALSYAGEVKTNNIDRINFYWDPSYPLIVIKQVHELYKLKQFMNQNAVYNLKHPLKYKSPKSSTNILSLRDSYLMRKTNSDVFEFYKMGISKMNQSINILSDLKSVRSKFYEIES